MNGKDYNLDIKDNMKSCFWSVEYNDDTLTIYTCEKGNNNCEPFIQTNMFDMSKEKNYFLYINDSIFKGEQYNAWYIDLQKAEL